MAARYRRRLRRWRRRRLDARSVGGAALAGLILAAAAHVHHPATHHQAAQHYGTAATARAASAAGGIVALGRHLASAYGWGHGRQWRCLDALWARESGWSPYADTRRTGLDAPGAAVYAYGIPQARPAQKMAAAGPDWRTDPATQIRWGVGYIAATYHTPCAAWAHELADGWY